MATKINLKKLTESRLIAALYNANANYIKKQQDNMCKFCREREKMINHIVSEYSTLAQKHELVKNMIHREFF